MVSDNKVNDNFAYRLWLVIINLNDTFTCKLNVASNNK